MTNRTKTLRGSCAAAAFLAALLAAPSTLQAQNLPTDVKPTCTVSPGEFAGWFASGSVGINGVVKAANSVGFPSPAQDCDFYKWSHQMLLWLLSPTGGSFVFNSPVFYDIDGDRMVPLGPNVVRSVSVRDEKNGAMGLPVRTDARGRIINLVKSPQVRDRAGNLVSIADIRARVGGQVTLLDKAGKSIVSGRGPLTLIPAGGSPIRVVETLRGANGEPLFVTADGQLIGVDQGQAGGGGVLIAQNGTAVFYTTEVNDVYAYFRTATKNGAISATQFPTTQPQLDEIVKYASGAPIPSTLPDAVALTIELKMSWIEAKNLDLSRYATIQAIIPNYVAADPHEWVQRGTRQATLALVGIHIVGSVNNHPEMTWATFEHVDNAPLDAYSYLNTAGTTVNVPRNTQGNWTFAQSGTSGPFNVERQKVSGTSILAVSGQTVGPPQMLRINPWGSAGSDPQIVAKNTQVLSINNSVLGQLAAGDRRKNYIMSGATWALPGQSPPSGEVGTITLANSTMESYHLDLNCFACHTGNTTGVSHIYNGLNPLFPK